MKTQLINEEKHLTIGVPISIKLIDYMFIGAFEGGSNYWCWFEREDLEKAEAVFNKAGSKRDKSIHYAWMDAVYQGLAELPVYDKEEDVDFSMVYRKIKEGANPLGTISLETIRKGIEKMAVDSPSHYADMIREQYDATTSDVFFQYVLMGKIVYG